MAHFHNPALIGASGQAGYQISRSLRFNSADSAYLNRTPASAGNRRTWTWSAWIKFSSISASSNGIFEAATNSSNRSVLVITANSQLQWFDSSGGSTVTQLLTSQVFRDFSAWYHIVVAVDTTQATSSNRVKIYVNGSQVTAFGTATYPSQNFDTQVNAAVATVLGAGTAYTPSAFYDGYLTEINFIDGQALTPSSFGETDTITGVWKPKRYAGTYGTNGFYLNFSDNSGTTSTTLGKDSSGNGNNWTPNNFSVTAGAGNDSLIDTPTPYADGGNGRGNYCVMNPLEARSNRIPPIDGNLTLTVASGANGYFGSKGTFGVTTGKWYWEVNIVTKDSGAGQWLGVGIVAENVNWPAGNGLGSNSGGYEYLNDGTKWGAGVATTGYGASYTNGDVIGVALDPVAQTLTFYKNGVSQGTAFTSIGSGQPWLPTAEIYRSTGTTQTLAMNFGQRPFAYTPPSGFVALNTQNLPEPSIKKPSSYMDVKLYTGTGATQSITGLGFSPDLVWTKGRGSATYNNHLLYDSVRGTNKILQSNQTAAESTLTTGLTSFNSDGFTIGAFDDGNTNANTYVAWCWDESATPGFDIVTFTAQATAATVNHSLGVAPKFIIMKDRDTAVYPWLIYHANVGIQKYLQFTTAGSTSASTVFSTSPTSTVFDPGTGVTTGNGYNRLVAYLWSEVAGFSKFGSYTGNGSSDGPFVFCGFRPAFIMAKRTDSTGNWLMYDKSRVAYNVNNTYVYANSSAAENTDGSNGYDFLSNGFKVRNTYNDGNTSSATYVFAAFSESPFKYSLAR